jgi:DNA ligase (NAD+)
MSKKSTKIKLKKIDEKIIKQINKNPIKFATDLSIKGLVSYLKTFSDAYYNSENSIVSDDVFDVFLDTLKERDPENINLQIIGAPISKDKVKLPYPMYSLDKIKPDKGALEKFKNKYKGPFVESDKLDGVSALIHKKDKKVNMYTRGDGEYGQDISYLIPYVLPKNVLLNDMPEDSAVRGELLISKKNFKTISKENKNARNTVAGLVNSKTYDVSLAKLTDFVAYAIINPEYAIESQMKKLKQLNFPVVNYKVSNLKTISEELLSKDLIERRKEGLYEIDGIVVIDSSKSYPLINKNPEHGFAFKTVLADQVAVTTILKVVWNPSMHGYLKPTLHLKPVRIGGVTIKQATAFNAKYVKEHNLGPGAVIKIVRSGDVIPHILEVQKPSTSKKPSMPGINYKWDKTNTNIIIKDLHGDANDVVTVKKISNFFKKLGVKYISEGIVTRLVDSGYDSIFKVLQAKPADLEKIDGIGDTLVSKIFTNIENAFKTVTLQQLMGASMIFGIGIGVRKARLVVDKYPDIMKVKWNTDTMIEKLIEIDGYDTTTATLFANNYDKFKTFYKNLKKIADISHLDKVISAKDKAKLIKDKKKLIFADMKVVFTGFRDKDLEKFIEDNGGKITSTVSGNTSMLVYGGDKSSSKYKKAVVLKIPTFTKDEFLKKYK